MIALRREPVTSAVAAALIGALNAELRAAYPEPGATHFRLDPEEVAPGRGAFLVAIDGETPIGCGAVRLLDAGAGAPGDAELKRMYVAPAMRGRGVGRLLLEALVDEARRLGARQVVLETGIRQDAALALYRRHGFAEIPPYGEYRASPGTSVCLGRGL